MSVNRLILLCAVLFTSLTVSIAQEDMQVIQNSGSVPILDAPSVNAYALHFVEAGEQLSFIQVSSDGLWTEVWIDSINLQGWIASHFIEPIADSTTSSSVDFKDVVYNGVTVLSGINQHTIDIFNAGQAMGNRATVFSKVGDSITEASWFLNPIGRDLYVLGEHDHLQQAIDYFSTQVARNDNSFLHDSVAMASGWNAGLMQDPDYADPTICQIGETPLACEYRTARPAIALIMFGTNDIGYMDQYLFRDNMTWIIQTSIDYGVIPVISTIPNRLDVSERVPTFNAVIRDLAQQYDIPLWDYKAVLDTLPDEGLSSDGVHPNISPHSTIGQADFTDINLQYGYPMRNFTALQVLNSLLEQVIYRSPMG